MTTRRARSEDLAALVAIDGNASPGSERAAFLARAVDTLDVLVTDDAGVTAFGVLHRGHFFGHDFVELLVVAEPHRRRGSGSALLASLAELSGGRKVFTSTNTSNAPMRALLARDGWVPCGKVDHLDPGDPELFFVRLREEP